MIKEDWVKVKGVDGFFVSNLGRVKSSKGRVKCSKRDNITREIAETILKPIQYNNSNSSLFYHMRCKSGSVVLVRAEYLFYENFIGRRGFYSIISHKDGDVFNNKIDNLIENAHQDKMNERWKTLKENEKYEISCFGRVRSKIPEIKDDLYFYKTPKDNLPKQVDNGSGYLKVSVNLKRSQYVHVLVCSNFIGVRPPKYDICHNDGDSKNNHISNLRYDTRKGNSSDKEIHGTSLKGEASPRAILTKKEVFKIREMMSSNHKQFIANKFNVSLSTIYDIDRRRSWNHI